MKRILFLASLVIGVLFLAVSFTKSVSATENFIPLPDNDNKVTICHATPAEANPYVQQSPNKSSDVSGHDGHENDIIPPFSYTTKFCLPRVGCIDIPHFYEGKNWDTDGQEIWNNDCEVPDEEPEPETILVCFDNGEDEPFEREIPKTRQAWQRVLNSYPESYIGECKDESTIRWCFLYDGDEHEYQAEAIPSGSEPKEGKPWEQGMDEWCEFPEEPQPDPEPQPENREGSSPSPETHPATAPVCGDPITVQAVANPHVLRLGSKAIVNFFVTQGDRAHVYWSEVGQPHWQHSSAGENPEGLKPNGDNFVTYTVDHLSPNLGYDFGVQQVQGCGGGLVTSVIVDGPVPQLFMLSYLEY